MILLSAVSMCGSFMEGSENVGMAARLSLSAYQKQSHRKRWFTSLQSSARGNSPRAYCARASSSTVESPADFPRTLIRADSSCLYVDSGIFIRASCRLCLPRLNMVKSPLLVNMEVVKPDSDTPVGRVWGAAAPDLLLKFQNQIQSIHQFRKVHVIDLANNTL